MMALCTEMVKMCGWYIHALKDIEGDNFDM